MFHFLFSFVFFSINLFKKKYKKRWNSWKNLQEIDECPHSSSKISIDFFSLWIFLFRFQRAHQGVHHDFYPSDPIYKANV